MSDENWVKLPEPFPKTIPPGTRIKHRFADEPLVYGVALVFEGGYYSTSTSKSEVEPSNVIGIQLPPGYRFDGSEVVRDCCERKAMADAGGVEHVCLGVDPAVPGSERTVFVVTPKSGKSALLKEYEAQVEGLKEQFAKSIWVDAGDYVFRQGDYQGIESPIAREVREEPKKLACKCGATENLRPIAVEYVTSWGKKQYGGEDICAPCYVARRRAEIQAAKLDQAKRDLDRPAQKKRAPYEWLGFSSSSWEE